MTSIAWRSRGSPTIPPPWPTKLHEQLFEHPFLRSRRRPPVEVVPHPLAHAVVAFHGSGFDEAAILIVDGQGDGISTTLAHGTRDGIRLLDQYGIEDSIGFFYHGVTAHLGWNWGQEGKTMGLAPYGEDPHGPPAFDLLDEGYAACVRAAPADGHWRRGRATLAAWRRFLAEQFGEPAVPRFVLDPLTQRPRRAFEPADRERAVAAWAQGQLERVLAHLAAVVIARTSCPRLVLGGGTAYNCAANGRLRSDDRVADVYAYAASGDAGTSIGAALEMAGLPGAVPLESAALGPGFTDDAIARLLQQSGIAARRCDDVSTEAARLIAAGRVVGWFQGRLEIGPRALGQRSILASPRTAATRDRVNAMKLREPWRPLAPSLLAEVAAEYLTDARPTPFMLLATPVRDDRRDGFPRSCTSTAPAGRRPCAAKRARATRGCSRSWVS